MNARIIPFLWIRNTLLVFALPLALSAWVRDGGPVWSDGTVTLRLMLGANTTYSDGTSPNGTALTALNEWNIYIERVQLAGVSAGAGQGQDNNGINEVFFSNTVYGQTFDPNALAVTIEQYTTTVRSECDVVVNSGESWDSYRGPLRTATDLRRVLAHEFGHVLGLDHPDAQGQGVTALMNSTVSDYVEVPQDDDIDGATTLYGHRPDSSVPPPVITQDVSDFTTYAGNQINLSINATGKNLTYQWHKDGTDITDANHSTYTVIAAKLADAGLYSVTISTAGGSITSRQATVSVLPPPLPVITRQPQSTYSRIGGGFSFTVFQTCPVPVTYQWFKDNTAIPNATFPTLTIPSSTPSDLGNYSVTITNSSGTVTSDAATVTFLAKAPPPTGFISVTGTTVGDNMTLDATNIPFNNSSLNLQWYHNGSAIPGATGDFLTIPKATSGDGGDYTLCVTDDDGRTISQTINVTVSQLPSTGAENWLAAAALGSIEYFLYANPARLERYDMASGVWLPSVTLNLTPNSFVVDPHGIFISTNAGIYSFNLDGTNQSAWGSSSITKPTTLFATANYLVVDSLSGPYTSHLSSLRFSDGSVASTSIFNVDGILKSSTDRSKDRIFLSSLSGTPATMAEVDVRSDGSFAPPIKSPYFAVFPDPHSLNLDLDGSLIVSDSGAAYSSIDLSYITSLPKYRDIAFLPDGSGVASEDEGITYFDPSLTETGWMPLAGGFGKLGVSGNSVFGFNPSTTTGGKPLVSLLPGNPGNKRSVAVQLDPTSLGIYPDFAFVGDDRNLYICDIIDRNIFCWSPKLKTYIAPAMALQGSPNEVAYSPTNNRIYIAYDDHRVTQVRLDQGETSEIPFVRLPGNPTALIAVGPSLFFDVTVDGEGSDEQMLYDKDGHPITLQSGNGNTSFGAWDPILGRIYYFAWQQYGTLRSLTIGPNGLTNDETDFSGASTLYATPVTRTSPDGAYVAIGSGDILTTATGQFSAQRIPPIDDAAWVGDTLYSLENSLNGALIERWDQTHVLSHISNTIPGRGLRLFAVGANLLLLTFRNGILHYVLLDSNLNQLSDDGPVAAERMIGLSSRAPIGTGDNILVSGFVVNGNTPKQVVIRAVGPGLASYIPSGTLADPLLTIYDDKSLPIASNDNYGDATNLSALQAAMTRLGLFNLPDGSRDAAMLVTLNPGLYTAQVSGVNKGTGVGILEIYDADEAPGSCRMTCLSSRAQVGTGDNILVSGIIVSGSAGKTLLIRGDGPVLAKYGVSSPLSNPRIRLFKNSTLIAQNMGWTSDATQVAALKDAATKTGLFQLDDGSKDAALLIHLDPGVYTAQVDGADGGTGVALLEVYEVPQ